MAMRAMQSREDRLMSMNALRSKSKTSVSTDGPAQSKMLTTTDARLDMQKNEEDVMRTLKQLEEQQRWTTANASVKYWQNTLTDKLGIHSKANLKSHQRLAALPKQRKAWTAKAKDVRLATDAMTKEMKADVLARYKQEMAFSVPTVRTALRIHDELDIEDQIAATSDESGPLSLGTSTAFIDTILKLNLLQGEVKEIRQNKELEERRKAAKLATIEHYKQVKTLEQGKAPERQRGWTEEEKAAMERPMTVAVGKFDRWLGRKVVSRLDCECISPKGALRQSRSLPSRDFVNTR